MTTKCRIKILLVTGYFFVLPVMGMVRSNAQPVQQRASIPVTYRPTLAVQQTYAPVQSIPQRQPQYATQTAFGFPNKVAPAPSSPSVPVKTSVVLPLQPMINIPTKPLMPLPTVLKPMTLEGKIVDYQKKFAALTPQTDTAILQKIMDDFIKDVVSPVISLASVLLPDINQTLVTVDKLITALAILNNQLGGIAGQDARREMISLKITELKEQKTQLAEKEKKQKDFQALLEKSRTMPPEKFAERIASYAQLFDKADAAIIDQLKQDIVTDLIKMSGQVKNAENTVLESFKKLLGNAQNNKFFTPQQKQQLMQILQMLQPASVLTTAQMAQASEQFQKKLKEIAACKTVMEKIMKTSELVPLISASSVPQEKDSVFSQCRNLYLMLASMKLEELAGFQVLVNDLTKNPFLLSVDQRVIVTVWQTALNTAVSLFKEQGTVLEQTKKMIIGYKTDYQRALESALYAVDVLFKTTLMPQELNKKQKTSLVGFLREYIPLFYNNRARKSPKDIETLNAILKSVVAYRDISEVVNPQWVASLSLNVELESIKTQTNVLAKIASILKVVSMLKATSDRYEKGIIVREIEDLFAKRKDRAGKEIEEIEKLLDFVTSNAFKKKNVFDRFETQKMEDFKKILGVTMMLQRISTEKVFNTKMEKLEKAIPLLSDDKADSERAMIVPIFNALFDEIGNLRKGELNRLVKLFDAAKSKPRVLAPNQVPVIDFWINKLKNAVKQTTDPKTYIESLIANALQGKNTNMLMQAISIVTTQTPIAVRGALTNALSTFFGIREQLKKEDIVGLFEFAANRELNTKKVDGQDAHVFTQEQRNVLQAWMKLIQGPVTPVLPAAPVQLAPVAVQ